MDILLIVLILMVAISTYATNRSIEFTNRRIDVTNGWLDTLVNGSAKDARKELLDKVDALTRIHKESLEVQKNILSCLRVMTFSYKTGIAEASKCENHDSPLPGNRGDLPLCEQIKALVTDGHKALKISVRAKMPLEEISREIIKLYQAGEITKTQCETALERQLTEDEISMRGNET